MPNRYNGQTIIIHAKSVSVGQYAEKFTELEESACAYAVSLPVSIDRLQEWWKNVFVHKIDDSNLPKALPVMDTKPTYNIDEVKRYFDDKLNIHKYGAKTELVIVDPLEDQGSSSSSSTSSCKVFEIHLPSQLQTEFQARFIFTPEARNFEELGTFLKYTDETVRNQMGFNSGYSRWLDDHWGFSGVLLDDFRNSLEASKTPYHAHVTEIMDGIRCVAPQAHGQNR